MPFAVIGSEQEFEVGGKVVRGRKYPWGVLEGACTRAKAHHGVRFPNPRTDPTTTTAHTLARHSRE